MTTLDYALAYLTRGWSVIPLAPGTKRPAVELKPFLDGALRLDEDGARLWWSQSYYGIGIICGRPSGGLVVIDVDPRNGGDIAASLASTDSACHVETGGGGLHIYCRADGVVPKGKTALPGVDRQGDGGYVVAPPSVHPDTGRLYAWLCDVDLPLGPLPAWALERSDPTPIADSDHAPWVADTLAHPERCEPGTQEETLTRLAWWAAGALDQDIAEAVLTRWIKGLTLGSPRDPWTSEHVHAKLAAAFAKREPEFTVEGVSSDATVASASVADIEAQIIPAAEYEVVKRDDWIVEHIAAPGCFTEVVGEVKKGKTTFNGHMIRSILAGEPFLGWRVRQTPVVLYTEQVGLSLDATLERAGVRRHSQLYLLDQSKTFGRPWSAVVSALLRRCQAVGAKLLFIDTLTRLAGVAGEDENKAGVIAVLNPFQAAKALGIACVFVRHAGKSRENREDVSRAGRGSTAITGEMDIAVNLYQPGSEDVRKVKIISRLGEEVAVLLRYNGTGYDVTDEVETPVSAPARRTAEMREKVEAEFRSGNTTVKGIARALPADPKTVRKYLREITGGVVDVEAE